MDGVFLTHTHIGHYLGLAFFGFEAIHTRQLALYVTPSAERFLRQNGPWSQLVELDNIKFESLAPGVVVELGEGVEVRALAVPHRNEFSDTVGFLISGPHSRLLYVPDTDAWRAWPEPLTEVLERWQVDVTLLDATFYSMEEKGTLRSGEDRILDPRGGVLPTPVVGDDRAADVTEGQVGHQGDIATGKALDHAINAELGAKNGPDRNQETTQPDEHSAHQDLRNRASTGLKGAAAYLSSSD